MSIRAIETSYKGYRFRSRLEARWAVFFDALNIEYVYEKEGYILSNGDWYLPDFWLPKFNCFAEVKPTKFTETEFNKCWGLDQACLLLDTPTPKVNQGYYYLAPPDGEPPHISHYKIYLLPSDFGAVLLGQSALKGRLWFLWGERPEDYWIDNEPETAAKSARFEYSEIWP